MSDQPPEPLIPASNLALKRYEPAVDNVLELIQENLGGSAQLSPGDFTRVRFPRGEGRLWEVETADGQDTEEEVRGVVVFSRPSRAFFSTRYDPTASAPPDCASFDAVKGIGDNGTGMGTHDCVACPKNQWGSDGNGKACKERMNLYVLRPGEIFPLHVALPPTSLTPWKRYFLSVINRRQRLTTVETILRIGQGEGYPIVAARVGRELGEEEVAFIDSFRVGIKRILEQDVERQTAEREASASS